MSKAWKHFKTITRHKLLVMEGCFKVGLYRQGITHDLSKYSPSEFIVGARYWQGNRSPNNAEREDKGYSSAWLHHKGRNRHHFEYWLDYSARDNSGEIIPAPMPLKYVIEMFMDRIAACKVYNGDAYTDQDPLLYYQSASAPLPLHPRTKRQLEFLLHMLADYGEEKTFRYIRTRILHGGKGK